jgi:hypothetical protein
MVAVADEEASGLGFVAFNGDGDRSDTPPTDARRSVASGVLPLFAFKLNIWFFV